MHVFNTPHNVILRTMLLLVSNKPQDSIVETNDISLSDSSSNNSTEAVCYDIYGCYNMTYPWKDDSLRPLSRMPEPPEKVNPKYCLYTRHNSNCQQLYIMTPSSLFGSYFQPRLRTYIISHGFIESGNKDWIKKMTNELLKLSDCNVIVVDWSGGSGPPYPQAVANIRLVGSMTAHLIKNLIEQGTVNPDLIHFIGHSLGSHMAAYAGETLQSKFGYTLGRITGLDPAEPHFSKTDPIVRLDPTDARFVDVIHTDAGPFISGGLGILQPVGHVDFYPNGGIQQPGCRDGVISYMTREMSSFYRGIRQMISCNHVRSYQYFIESINPGPCSFMGTECSSWEEFQNGTCFNCSKNNICPFQLQMGLHADSFLRKGPAYGSPLKLPPPRTYVQLYLMTGSESPFCRHHYHMTWKISDSCKSLLHGGEIGKISITIKGEKGVTRSISLSDSVQYYEPGSTYHATVAGDPIGKMKSAILHWEYQTSPWNPLTWRILATPHIYITWMEVESVEGKDRLLLCPEEDIPVTARKSLILGNKLGESNCKVKTIPKTIEECKQFIH